MRPTDGRAIPNFLAAGASGRAAHGLRRRPADAELLLRRRPRRRHRPPRCTPSSTIPSTSVTRRSGRSCRMAEVIRELMGDDDADRSRAAAGATIRRSASRTSRRRAISWAGADDQDRGRACATTSRISGAGSFERPEASRTGRSRPVGDRQRKRSRGRKAHDETASPSGRISGSTPPARRSASAATRRRREPPRSLPRLRGRRRARPRSRIWDGDGSARRRRCSSPPGRVSSTSQTVPTEVLQCAVDGRDRLAGAGTRRGTPRSPLELRPPRAARRAARARRPTRNTPTSRIDRAPSSSSVLWLRVLLA